MVALHQVLCLPVKHWGQQMRGPELVMACVGLDETDCVAFLCLTSLAWPSTTVVQSSSQQKHHSYSVLCHFSSLASFFIQEWKTAT